MREARIALMLLAGLAMVLGTSGCVTQGKYDELSTDRDQLQADRDRLAGEVDALAAANMELGLALEATEEEVAALAVNYDGLVGELQTEVASGQIEIQQLIDGIRMNVSDELLFPSGSTDMNERGKELLGKVAAQIKGGQSIISVEGHTDNVRVGPKLKQRYPTNWELAGARAARIVRLLSEQGVEPAQLRAVSRGPFVPIASNDTEEGRAKNRRTEIIVRPMPR
jgi:chemotaxis protein MotB